jgi:hypothetical protein
MFYGNAITVLIITIFVVGFLFLALRQFFTWYWKVNEIIGLLRRIDARLAGEPVPVDSQVQSTNTTASAPVETPPKPSKPKSANSISSES